MDTVSNLILIHELADGREISFIRSSQEKRISTCPQPHLSQNNAFPHFETPTTQSL